MSTERERLIKWAKQLADLNWCLSVPKEAKDTITALLKELEPRTVTTVEELDALAGGTIIRAVKSEHNPHGLCFEKYGKEWLALDPADREDGEVTIPHAAVLRFYGAHSITALFTPEDAS